MRDDTGLPSPRTTAPLPLHRYVSRFGGGGGCCCIITLFTSLFLILPSQPSPLPLSQAVFALESLLLPLPAPSIMDLSVPLQQPFVASLPGPPACLPLTASASCPSDPDPRRSWSIVSSAIFLPCSASWLLLSSPLLPPPHLVLFPPFHLRLALSSSISLDFPLPCLSFSRLPADASGCPPASTTLFAAFHHVSSHQKHKLALRFSSPSHLVHCLTALQTAATFGSHTSPRLRHHLSLSSPFHRYSHKDLDINPVGSQDQVDPEPLPSSVCAASSAPLIAQEPEAACPSFREVKDACISNLRSLPPISIQHNLTSEPEVDAADGRNLNMGQNEPVVLRNRRAQAVSLSRFFPATRCVTIPPAFSNSLEVHNNYVHRQMCDQDLPTEVEDRQQSSCRGIEDGLDNHIDPSPFIPMVDGTLNRPQGQSLQQSGWGLDIRSVEKFNVRAAKDSDSGDLRSELLGCLLDPSFRLLVERLEDLVGEIEDPANIDLAALAEFLALRT